MQQQQQKVIIYIHIYIMLHYLNDFSFIHLKAKQLS